MMPNGYGNFFRHEPLVPPLAASLVSPDGQTVEMRGEAPHGSCNRCHTLAGAGLLTSP
jgi:hypothetical protein